MKKITSTLLLLLTALTLQNCSTVKVLDAWQSDDVAAIRDNNFIVISRTDDDQIRRAFENKIVEHMTDQGVKATASYTKFPKIDPNEKITEERRKEILKILNYEGFDAVILTALKDYQEDTRINKDGGYYVGGDYLSYYPRYYGGFGRYYYHPYAYSTAGAAYVEETTTITTSKIYILETTVYDLTRPDENQLVTVVTSKVDNPQNVTDTAEQYVAKVSKAIGRK
ncbi:MAG: hypothetical protein AAGC45_13770 [Bacteroidota bacterium]